MASQLPFALPGCLLCVSSAGCKSGCFILVDSEEERDGTHFTGVIVVHCTTEAPGVLPNFVGPLWNPRFIPAPNLLGRSSGPGKCCPTNETCHGQTPPLHSPQVCSGHHSITGGSFNPRGRGRGRGVPPSDRAPVWRAARAGETERKDLTPRSGKPRPGRGPCEYGHPGKA